MPRATQRKIYRKALRAGAAPVRDAAQVNIASVSKKFTGIAQRRGTIRIYSLKLYRGMYRVAVMVKRGLVNPAKRGKDGGPVRVGLYLAVLEYGSDKLGRAPKSWIRKALREKESDAKNEVTMSFRENMDEAVYEARRKSGAKSNYPSPR